jgi:futalosine hydrolase
MALSLEAGQQPGRILIPIPLSVSRKIAFVAATEKEIEPLLSYLSVQAEQHSFQTYQLHGLTIDVIYTGIGILQTTYALMDYLSHRHPDVWIQAGIGGAFDPQLSPGEVYYLPSEVLIGIGAEDTNGRIMDPFELEWNDPDAYPYSNGKLECPYEPLYPTAEATGMTTFYAHGQPEHIESLRKQPHGQIENMEGAAFFYISLIKKIPFLSIRSISNLVEARDTKKWNLDLAIQNLGQHLTGLLEDSQFNPDKLLRDRRS